MAQHVLSPDFEPRVRLFGQKVRWRRNELGLTEMQLIERTGPSRSYIQLLLNSRGSHEDPATGTQRLPNPTLDVVWLLAEALEVDAAHLVDYTRLAESFDD